MNLIVAVDNNWGIGCNDRLLFRIREDLRRFRALTIGKTIILDRKTLQTLPEGKPLVGRANIVMTRNEDFRADPAVICHSINELPALLAGIPRHEIFVVGGASIYDLLLPYCQTAFITRAAIGLPSDRHFPDLEQAGGWQLVSFEHLTTEHALIEGSEIPRRLEVDFCVFRQSEAKVLGHDS